MVKDQAVAAVIDKKDKPAFLRLAAKIRKEVAFNIKKGLPYEGKDVTEFWNQCNRKYNDHHIAILQIGNRNIEIEDAIVTKDLPTNGGIDQCIRLFLATSSTLYRYMEIGSGSGTPSVGDFNLITPYTASRCDMNVQGTREPVGMTIRFLAIFGESFAAPTVSECGVFTNSTGGTLLNHNVFAENPLKKITGQQAAAISSIVEFCPKA